MILLIVLEHLTAMDKVLAKFQQLEKQNAGNNDISSKRYCKNYNNIVVV